MRSRLLPVLALLSALAIAPHALAQNTGSLTLETTVAAGQITPKLTWTTTPAATSCTATGDWTGTKAAQGTETLAAFPVSTPKNWTLRCTWPGQTTLNLTWVAPTTNTDGSALAKCAASTDTGPCLAKYRIHWGTAAGQLTQTRDHNFPTATTATLTGLTANTTYFVAVRAIAGNGAESALSNEVSKTTAAQVEWTQSVGVKVPNAPSGLTAELAALLADQARLHSPGPERFAGR